jgi:DNA-binding NtrC family response regulator
MFDEHDLNTDTEPNGVLPANFDGRAAALGGAMRLHAEPLRRRALQPSRAEQRRGRVLVIDDDPRISLSLQLILSEWHDVTALTSPCEALLRMRHGETYDVVLCDVMMPELSAMDLYAALERELPGIASRLVFLTGGAFTPRAHEFLAQIDNARFEKPLDIDGLIALVRRRVALRLLTE